MNNRTPTQAECQPTISQVGSQLDGIVSQIDAKTNEIAALIGTFNDARQLLIASVEAYVKKPDADLFDALNALDSTVHKQSIIHSKIYEVLLASPQSVELSGLREHILCNFDEWYSGVIASELAGRNGRKLEVPF